MFEFYNKLVYLKENYEGDLENISYGSFE